MATPPPGFPIVDFATLVKSVPLFFERMPRFFDGGYTGKRHPLIWKRKLRSPDAEQMREDIQRAEAAYRPEPIVITISLLEPRYSVEFAGLRRVREDIQREFFNGLTV